MTLRHSITDLEHRICKLSTVFDDVNARALSLAETADIRLECSQKESSIVDVIEALRRITPDYSSFVYALLVTAVAKLVKFVDLNNIATSLQLDGLNNCRDLPTVTRQFCYRERFDGICQEAQCLEWRESVCEQLHIDVSDLRALCACGDVIGWLHADERLSKVSTYLRNHKPQGEAVDDIRLAVRKYGDEQGVSGLIGRLLDRSLAVDRSDSSESDTPE